MQFWQIFKWYAFGTYSGALLPNTGSPSRSYDQWLHCWTKQGPALGTQQYFHFLRSTFFRVNLSTKTTNAS